MEKTAAGRGTLSPATAALRQGSGPGDGALMKIVRPGPDARWRPLKGGGLELVDRCGRSAGWAYVPLARVAESPGAEKA